MTQKRKTLLITVLAAASILLMVIYIFSLLSPPAGPGSQGAQRPAASPSAPVAVARETATVAEIGIVNVIARSSQARVTGYGEVMPQYALSLSAEVGGRIESLSPRFATGERVKQGDVLATIDAVDYQQALAAANVNLQDATVALEEERLQGEQAKDEWQRSGLSGEPASPLVLRAPQLAAAQASYEQAKAAVKQAQRNLDYTRITAPFDGVIVTRSIQPGSTVLAGTEVASLYSANIAEIAVPLSAAQWQSLPEASSLAQAPWSVTVADMDGTHQWQGYIRRIEQHLDTTSRQRSAIVEIALPLDQPSPLYFGTYVVANINGRVWDNVWQIPTSAISQKQRVWYVTDQNLLANFSPDVLYQNDGQAFIKPVAGMESAKIVVRPLNSYLVNMKVKPVQESSNGN